MGMYVIDSSGGLWRVDREADEDFNTLGVERPACAHCGHRETARLAFSEVIVDPTDSELAALSAEELARFGLTTRRLLPNPTYSRFRKPHARK